MIFATKTHNIRISEYLTKSKFTKLVIIRLQIIKIAKNIPFLSVPQIDHIVALCTGQHSAVFRLYIVNQVKG